MASLVSEAQADHWRTAIQSRFQKAYPEQFRYGVDLNRASWIPLLPIGPQSTVLEVGSGFGAITHALALNYAHVVSIEPRERRVQFSKVRIDQEHLSNVDLIQTTIDALPFFDASFDLIVLNGLLQRIGEWSQEHSPREAQIHTLTVLRGLLKENGILLIGIDNRIGLSVWLGGVDDSGLRFTSLMPRPLASFYVRLRRPGFYRTLFDPSKGYRTCTYTVRGYRKLLRAAGFRSADVWWPPDGYDRPTVLIRASERSEVKAYSTRSRNYKNRVDGYTLRGVLKAWTLEGTNLLVPTLADGLLMVAPRGDGETATKTPRPDALMTAVSEVIARHGATGSHRSRHQEGVVPVSLSCHSCRNKAIIRVNGAGGRPAAVVKVANTHLPDADVIERTYRLMACLQARFDEQDSTLRGTIPEPIGLVHAGPVVASIESPAQGRMLQDAAMARGYFGDPPRVARHLDLLAAWLILAQPELKRLETHSSMKGIPAFWRHAPQAREALEGSGAARQRSVEVELSWCQHGDFFPENVFLDHQERTLSVIDWDQAGPGYPPLFDWFCLVTGMYYTHRPVKAQPPGKTVDPISFRQTYFEASWFADLILSITHRMCRHFGLPRESLLQYFAEYLAVRHNQFRSDSDTGGKAQLAADYLEEIDYLRENKDRCIFGYSDGVPTGRAQASAER